MCDFQIFVKVIGKGSDPLGARTQSPNLLGLIGWYVMCLLSSV